MNKRGHGFYVIMAILALFLVGYAYKILVIDRETNKSYEVGRGLVNLHFANEEYNEVINFLDFSFSYAVLDALENYSSKDDVWTKPPENIEIDIEKIVLANFVNRMNDFGEKIKGAKLVTFPKIFHVKIIKNNGVFTANLVSDDDLLLGGLTPIARQATPGIILYKKLEFEKGVDFDLDIYDELYDKYAKLDSCPSQNELFDKYPVKCEEKKVSDQESYLHYEVETEDLGLIKPVIKFNIPKTGNLFT